MHVIITSSARHFNQLACGMSSGMSWKVLHSIAIGLTITTTQPPRMLVHEVHVNAHDSLHCSFANAVIAIRNTHALNSAEQLASRL